jgi:hypothetical protein
VINMNSRIVLLSLISIFLLFALVVAASAQPRTVGVSMGNTFTYGVTVSWSSNDPTATPSSDIVEANNTQSGTLSITAISGTNVTGQVTTLYKNSTETTEGGWVDVNTGNGENLTEFLISANLAAGDSIYNSSSTGTINETVTRTYSSGVRNANLLNMTYSVEGLNYTFNYYWDQSTGVLVELLLQTTNQTAAYTTTSSENVQITSSNVWTVPEFPTWTSALLILIAVTSATIIISRKRQPKRPPMEQTETVTVNYHY